MDENELLFDELYEKTKDFGRIQFVRLLMAKERENKELKRKLNEAIHKATEFESEVYELKKQLEEKENIACNWKDSCLENAGKIEELENQQKEFISYLENEKDRLARECSHIYEDSLGKTRLVSKDIFNEVDKNLSKYQEIIGDDK